MTVKADTLQKGVDQDPLFRALVGTAVDGILIIGDHATVRFYNQACERLFGYTAEEVLGRNVKMLMPEPYRDEHDGYVSSYLSTGERHIIGIGREVVGQRKDGTTFPMYLSVGEGRLGDERIFVGIVHDITDRRVRDQKIQELQGELLHVTRITAMGQMSSALAHELNQPLTAILSYSKAAEQMAAAESIDKSELADVLAKIGEQSTRAGNIIRRLRAFVEKREPTRAPEDVNQLVQESLVLGLLGVRDSSIRLTVQLHPAKPIATVDKIEIQQVLVNLMRNAAEAMESSSRRELTVATDIDAPNFATVTVADTGPGLSLEVADRLFEPFVSTKANGMGMGLNICRTIIEAHGGRLSWAHNPGGGAVFRLRLPLHRTG